MRKRMAAVPAVAIALGVFGATAAQASNYSSPSPSPSSSKSSSDMSNMPGMKMPGMKMPQQRMRTMSRSEAIARSRVKAVYFAARLSGKNEVQVAGKPKVGDPDGSATGLVRLQGNRVTFAFAWKNISAPTLGHIHQGKAGVNGDPKVVLFGADKVPGSTTETIPMPDTATAAAGIVTVTDPAIADGIRKDPSGFYLNLHTKEFPGGAVRGQLYPLGGRTDVLRLVKGDGVRAFMSGDQEVPDPKTGLAVGDPDGRAVAFIKAYGTTVDYGFSWTGVTPTLGHIHQGRFGKNGPVVVKLFTQPVPSTILAMAGTVKNVEASTVNGIRKDPSGFYTNLHTTDFPGGAVRGQLFR
jgi:hypothetical protein